MPESFLCLFLVAHPTLCSLMDCSPPGSSAHGIFHASILEVGSHSLLQGIFLTQGMKSPALSLLHCRQILHHCTTWEVLNNTNIFSRGLCLADNEILIHSLCICGFPGRLLLETLTDITFLLTYITAGSSMTHLPEYWK